jgi:hypothetical protein
MRQEKKRMRIRQATCFNSDQVPAARCEPGVGAARRLGSVGVESLICSIRNVAHTGPTCSPTARVKHSGQMPWLKRTSAWSDR